MIYKILFVTATSIEAETLAKIENIQSFHCTCGNFILYFTAEIGAIVMTVDTSHTYLFAAGNKYILL